jgi:transposase
MEIMEVKRLDHLGVVMGVIKELGIIRMIDDRIKPDSRENVTTGEAIAAMILCGLGFTESPLSLTPQFFTHKAIENLFGEKVEADQFNRFKLGRSLDDAFEYGCDLLFAEVAKEACVREGVQTQFVSGDTTTFSVTGEYDKSTDEQAVTLTHGYSKDHRPDLKQVVQEMLVSQDGGVPIMQSCFDGNISDNVVLKKRANQLIQEFKAAGKPWWFVADSKLYFEGNAENLKQLLFITRIPRSINMESKIVKKDCTNGAWETLDAENKTCSINVEHYGIKQRWIVVSSEQAEIRATKQINKKIVRELSCIEKKLQKLKNKFFACQDDAKKYLAEFEKTLKYHAFSKIKTSSKKTFLSKGRPKTGQAANGMKWYISAVPSQLIKQIQSRIQEKKCYVIGTNTSSKKLSDREIVQAYKKQSSVEQGFRFLKNPIFFTSSFFLKKNSRIVALLMVMTLALLVYSIAQRRIRRCLKEQ